jgi:very-short-patch-repair endonuclease
LPRQRIPRDVEKARELRRQLSLPEGLLWRELRRRSGGVKIRNQHPIGRYVLDFYCAATRTGFEIDGISHDMGDRPVRDEERDAWLHGQGVTIVRIPATEVLADPTATADAIIAMCSAERS